MSDQVTQLRDRVTTTLGEQSTWTPWPGGWPNQISTALIDAIYSAQAQYETANGRGVLPLVKQWRKDRPQVRDSLPALEAEIGLNPAAAQEWAANTFGSMAVSPGRHHQRPDDRLKAAAVREAAQHLQDAGFRRAADVTVESAPAARVAMRRTPGVGFATASYFCMLLGLPGVKPDTMVHRFLEAATGTTHGNAAAVDLISSVAAQLDARPVDLEHAIWSHESRAAVHRRS